MDIPFYDKDSADRLSRTLALLATHNVSGWALTGGTAIELHLLRLGAPPIVRPLHDLDFVAAGFDCLPASLGDSVISRHVHPHDPPAKMMWQAVDPDTALMIDVFRAYGNEMNRARKVDLLQCTLQVVAFEDLVARHARLCCGLLRGQNV